MQAEGLVRDFRGGPRSARFLSPVRTTRGAFGTVADQPAANKLNEAARATVTRSNYADGSNSCRIPQERKERGADSHARTHCRAAHALTRTHPRSLRPLFARGSQGRAMCIARPRALERVTPRVHTSPRARPRPDCCPRAGFPVFDSNVDGFANNGQQTG